MAEAAAVTDPFFMKLVERIRNPGDFPGLEEPPNDRVTLAPIMREVGTCISRNFGA
jgi:hypothetical protein